MKNLLKITAPLVALSFIFAGCQQNSTSRTEESDKITVQATIFPLVDFAERIGGDHVEVASILPTGTDSHEYEPTQQQIVDIARSDIFIYNGAGMEGFADTILSVLEDEDTVVVKASDGVSLIGGSDGHDHGEDSEEDHDHGDTDPHIWFDPLRAITMAENILHALIEQQPENEEYFQANFDALKADLEELDAAYQEAIDNSELSTILVSHAAYGYWEERYGLEQISVSGLSSSDEPSQQELATLISKAQEHNIDTILFETTATSSAAQVVQKELGLNILYLNHVATITDEDAKANKDYFDLMYENLDVLKKVLNP